jgi:phosphopantetheine adenylyltransferase
MLLVISEEESYSRNSLEFILQNVLDYKDEDIHVLIISQPNLSVSFLIDQLSNIYDTFYRIKTKSEIKSEVTVLLNDERYDTNIATNLWSSMIHTSSIDFSKIPESYISHIQEDSITTINTESTSLKPQIHKEYRLANSNATYQSIPVAAVGGTFDHLHDGHKILLIVSAFLSGKTLIIGVTGPELLKNKKYVEYMESYETRVANVQKFLSAVRPSLIPDMYEINDVCGPTAQIQDINALIVSLESCKGADYVNNVRSELGWKKLDVYTIGVLGSADSETFKNKMSSTDYRKAEYLKNHLNKTM